MRLKLFTEKDIDRFYDGLVNGTQNGMKMRVKHPVLYWVMIALGLLVLLFPLVVFSLWQNKIGYHAYEGIFGGIVAIISVIASLSVGIALVNECMRIVDGYLGWKVTVVWVLHEESGKTVCLFTGKVALMRLRCASPMLEKYNAAVTVYDTLETVQYRINYDMPLIIQDAVPVDSAKENKLSKRILVSVKCSTV